MENLTDKEIEIVKTCAALIAKNYDPLEPWINPNTILRKFNIQPWEFIDGAWYDPETAVSHYF